MPYKDPHSPAAIESRKKAARKYYYNAHGKAKLRRVSFEQTEKYKEGRKRRWHRTPLDHRSFIFWKSWIKTTYGLTVEQYEVMLRSQGGSCAICKKKCSTGRRLSVDHCHKTRRVRGLLCSKCNRALGYFKDDTELMLTALVYLRKNGH